MDDRSISVDFAFVKPNTIDNKSKPKPFLQTLKQVYDKKNDANAADAASKFLWENFNKEQYSMWFCKCKYNEELTKIFITSGMISGWFARMENCRKIAFGVALILGNENGDSHELHAFWIFRSDSKKKIDELPENVQDVDDVANFEWRRITDFDDEKEKALVNDFLRWDGENLPKPCLEGRSFK